MTPIFGGGKGHAWGWNQSRNWLKKRGDLKKVK